MSEQKINFMQELDLWSDANIIGPLLQAAQDYREGDTREWEQTVEAVMKAIRTKVLESYRNGQQAGPRRVTAAPRGNVTVLRREVR